MNNDELRDFATDLTTSMQAMIDKALSVQDGTFQSHMAAIQAQLGEIRAGLIDIRGLVGPFGVRLAEDQLLVQTVYGTKYLVDPHDLIMTPQLVIYRQWESELSRFFSQRVSPDTIFVDIGANFGYFTCLAGSRIGTTGAGRVIAVEPNPALVKLLQANAMINWSMCPIEVLPVALGASKRTVQLSIPADRAANGSLTHTTAAASIDVSMERLDDLVPAGVNVNLVKLDVEGHEYGVLDGARRVISESTSIEIVMEWSSRQMIDAGYSINAMLQLIDSLNMRIVKIPEAADTGTYADYPINALTSSSYDNVLLVKKDVISA